MSYYHFDLPSVVVGFAFGVIAVAIPVFNALKRITL
jgi:hypothetical protein